MTATPRVVVAPPFSPDAAALNFAVRLLRQDHDDYELRHSHLSATDGDIPAIREALGRLADALANGVVLPVGTETVEQFAVQYLIDGEPASPYPFPTTRQGAESMVRAHDREAAANPDWRGSAKLIRRRQHTTPWATVEEKP